jgi:hypothetical protein
VFSEAIRGVGRLNWRCCTLFAEIGEGVVDLLLGLVSEVEVVLGKEVERVEDIVVV